MNHHEAEQEELEYRIDAVVRHFVVDKKEAVPVSRVVDIVMRLYEGEDFAPKREVVEEMALRAPERIPYDQVEDRRVRQLRDLLKQYREEDL